MIKIVPKSIRPYLNQRVLEILVYSVIWILIAIIPTSWAYDRELHTWDLRSLYSWWNRLIPFFVIFLINILWLIPRFLHKGNRRWLFFLLTGIFSVLVITLNPQATYKNIKIESHIREQKALELIEIEKNKPPRLDRKDKHNRLQYYTKPKIQWWKISLINDIIIAFTTIGVTISIRLLFKSIKDQQTMSELKNQNTEAELEYLKHQLSPHFLMNTLNNIHALIDISSEDAKHTIIELSKIMRYVLYDTSSQTVLLSRELQFTRNYIALMSIRYDSSVEIRINTPTNIPDVMIPPLLLQPFIENAFKHGISSIKKSFIYIDINISDSYLCCVVTNSNNHKQEESGGIGLENIKKRLQLLYNNRHSLEINNAPEVYTTTLKIPINNDTMHCN